MSKRLNGSAGTGDKIMNNLNLFNYHLDKIKNIDNKTYYTFLVSFGSQKGHFCIVVDENNNIDESSTLDLNFPKSLGLYNDRSLEAVAKLLLKSIKNVTKTV
ncbi:hypothetical protein [Clostridium perfringens]|uniref:hypothetical protein n=1 Tax=Clostridium perfringens TaxID=1502 RepID=UPI0039EAE6E2